MVRSPTSGRSRSLGLGDSDPETNASRLEHSIASKEEHDQESGLGLAWRPTGPGVRPNRAGPEKSASRLERSTRSKEEVYRESGLGLAWRPTGPGERPNQYPPAGVDPLNPLDRREPTNKRFV